MIANYHLHFLLLLFTDNLVVLVYLFFFCFSFGKILTSKYISPKQCEHACTKLIQVIYKIILLSTCCVKLWFLMRNHLVEKRMEPNYKHIENENKWKRKRIMKIWVCSKCSLTVFFDKKCCQRINRKFHSINRPSNPRNCRRFFFIFLFICKSYFQI